MASITSTTMLISPPRLGLYVCTQRNKDSVLLKKRSWHNSDRASGEQRLIRLQLVQLLLQPRLDHQAPVFEQSLVCQELVPVPVCVFSRGPRNDESGRGGFEVFLGALSKIVGALQKQSANFFFSRCLHETYDTKQVFMS